jgi:PAS domain S-box-containing protein
MSLLAPDQDEKPQKRGSETHRSEVTPLQALDRSERPAARLAELLGQAPNAIGLLLGSEHRWSFVNQALVAMYGRASTADFIGKTFADSLPEIAKQGVQEVLDQVYRDGQPYTAQEIQLKVNRGPGGKPQERYFELTCQPVRDEDGTREGIFVFASDVTERAISRQAIEDTAERLRLAQNAGQIGVWEWDPIQGKNNLSPELHRLFATEPSDADRLKTWLSRIHPADRNRVTLLMHEGHRLGQMEFEYRYQHPDLGVRWFLCKGQRRLSETRMFGIVQDITARKYAERAAEQLAAIVESSDDAIISKDLNGIVTSWNPAAERLFGYTTEEMVGQPITKIIPPHLHEDEGRILATIARGERIEHFETVRMTKNGDLLDISISISPVKDISGRIVGASKIARDTSERRRRDEFRFRLAAIVESSDDAIVSKDLNGIVTSWNPAAERLFGYSAEEMIGQSILKIIPSELYSDETRILSTIARGDRIEHFETVRRRKDGELIDISLTISPVRNEKGKIIGAAKIARDITQQKRAERALRTSERLASVGRLAATVAHEINNPLEAVTNLIFLARSAAGREEVRNYLGMAEEELERIAHLTRQTLGFYRETKGVSAVRLGGLVESLLSVFSPRMRAKGIQLCREINDDVEIRAVPGEIRQVIANLLSNSIDALETGGQIRVRVSRGRQWKNGEFREGVRLSVADTGSGIPEAIRDQLFEPFFTTKHDVGTGLGLWVCKSIVENHGGSIQVRSRTAPGNSGTVFSVLFPLQQAASSSQFSSLSRAIQ